MEQISFIIENDAIYVRKKVNAQLILGINIHKEKDEWEWNFKVWLKENKVEKVGYVDFKKTKGSNKGVFSVRGSQHLNIHPLFINLIIELKSSPKVRLKLIDKLSKDIRLIW